MGEKVVVTGAGGFIGSNLVKFLKSKGHSVMAVDIRFPKNRESLWGKADSIMELDLRDKTSALMGTQGKWVFHLASDMGGVEYFHNHDYTPFINNMRMDMNMLEAAHKNKVERFFYSSSACIYPTHLEMDENSVPAFSEEMIYPANSDQMYGWEKLMTLKLCERAPLDARVGIFHTIFGPYQEIEGERMKFPTAIATKALQAQKTGEPIEIWGNGQQKRTFLYIDDALEKIYRIMTQDYYGPVNVGSSEVLSVKDAADICCDILGISKTYVYNDLKPSGSLARGCDNTNFEKWYRYRNKFSTYQGFEKLIEWIKTQ